MQNDTSADVLTVQEVADRLKAARSTVYELIQRGELPAKRLGRARGLRIPRAAFEAWLATPDNQV